MIKERNDTSITELLQKHVHAVNDKDYRICSSDEQAFFTDVHELNTSIVNGRKTAKTGLCVTAMKSPKNGPLRKA